jgi:hypothetical protein
MVLRGQLTSFRELMDLLIRSSGNKCFETAAWPFRGGGIKVISRGERAPGTNWGLPAVSTQGISVGDRIGGILIIKPGGS